MTDPTDTDEALLARVRSASAAREVIARSDDPDARRIAYGALGEMGELSRADVVDMLDDPDLCRRGLELAAGFDDIVLTEHLESRDADLAEVAAFVVGERAGHPHAGELAALHTMARGHEDALCRETAVAALGAIAARLEDGTATDDARGAIRATVLAACGDRATVRRRAVIALASFDHPDTERALRAARDDRDRQVRRIATSLLDDEPER